MFEKSRSVSGGTYCGAFGKVNTSLKALFETVVEGVVLGIISAALSEVIVYFCYRVILESLGIGSLLGSAGVVSFSSVALQLFGIFAAIGVLAGVIGSVIIISKYLKHEGSEFRAYN